MGLGGCNHFYSFKNGFICSSAFFLVFCGNVISLLWLYGSFFEIFPEITDNFVEWYRYDYSLLWISDMADT